ISKTLSNSNPQSIKDIGFDPFIEKSKFRIDVIFRFLEDANFIVFDMKPTKLKSGSLASVTDIVVRTAQLQLGSPLIF
ncbi:MAG: hypothetical protein ACHQYP_09250, partial [Nitrospiria bacterium]